MRRCASSLYHAETALGLGRHLVDRRGGHIFHLVALLLRSLELRAQLLLDGLLLLERAHVPVSGLGRRSSLLGRPLEGWRVASKGLGPLPRRRGSALADGCGRSGIGALPLPRAAVISTRLRVRVGGDGRRDEQREGARAERHAVWPGQCGVRAAKLDRRRELERARGR